MIREAVFTVLVFTSVGTIAAQEKYEPITVHVKEVTRTRQNGEKATWFNISAVMESKTVIYSVECREYQQNDTGHFTIRCFPVAAGKDYSGKRLATSIALWPPDAKDDEYKLGVYSIISEKEK